MTKIVKAVTVLLVLTVVSAADERTPDTNKDQIRRYVEQCRERDIKNLRRLDVPPAVKAKLRKWYDSEGYLPQLNPIKPKLIGMMPEAPVGVDYRVLQVVNKTEFILEIEQRGSYVVGGGAAQPAIIEPGQHTFVWIKDKDTSKMRDGMYIKFYGAFLVEDTKQYPTRNGTKTVRCLRYIGKDGEEFLNDD